MTSPQFPAIVTTTVEWEDEKKTKPLEDNLDELWPQLLQTHSHLKITNDQDVKAAVDNHQDVDVVLCRGTRGPQLQNIVQQQSAGGATADANAKAPSEDERKQQIAKGQRLPEYAAKDPTKMSWSWRHHLVVVKINTRYLARGSSTESGWVAQPSAPVTVLATVDRTVGLPEPQGEPNAS
ncbi:DUF4765 family protein [Allorhizocola rhizosphaerae]|uniref:DUF4765 family protein n=1 Tax=Allorhizocola rhizosphaerae TaxID=1872709 RepID=UPI0013C3472B|nr:DUF4765 family protein [Allorhizocola rhizosphaerae]